MGNELKPVQSEVEIAIESACVALANEVKRLRDVIGQTSGPQMYYAIRGLAKLNEAAHELRFACRINYMPAPQALAQY